MKNILNLVNSFFSLKNNSESLSSKTEIRRAIRELKAMNDRELSDLGLARGQIEDAVRYGLDSNNNPRNAA